MGALAHYVDDRRRFISDPQKGEFHSNGNGRLMFCCPCQRMNCKIISVIVVGINFRPVSHNGLMTYDWNGSTAIPTIEPWIKLGEHWTGRLSGGIWYDHDQ